MNTDYKRGYSRGYSTGCRRSDAANAAERERADLAVHRAERAESATSIGHCEECQHWWRGGGAPRSEHCAWGVCQAPRAAGTPWGCWATGDDGKPIHTTPRFGCVLFAERSAEGASAALNNPATDVAEAVRQDETPDRRVRASSAGGEEP